MSRGTPRQVSADHHDAPASVTGQTVSSRRGTVVLSAALVLCSPNKPIRFGNLCRSVDGLVEVLPNHGEAALNRGFHVPNHCVNHFVGSIEERRNLVDTEQRIGVEREREKYFAVGEMLLVENYG